MSVAYRKMGDRFICKDIMTQNWRIAQNDGATYGWSLYALGIGLFCGWWTPIGRWFDCGKNGKICGIR